jgi:hypothetical protein
MTDFIVPLDDKVVDFGHHLRANARTILSSRFGDGKSYFLNAIRNDQVLAKEFEFLTLYPVNYQVADNKDIFDMIKRDILFQLMLHDMLTDRITFTNSEAWSWFIYSKGANLVLDLLRVIPDLGINSKIGASIVGLLATKKLFKSIKEKFDLFQKKNMNDEDALLDDFFKQAQNSPYQSDPIDSIIHRIIKDYKNQNNKKIVLIIEDLDRMDPAHIFRILNVLSAQIDIDYKIDIPETFDRYRDNKYGLDNIVLVVDNDNLKNIYRHFYGSYTDYKGYISKFLSSSPYIYSLQKTRNAFIISYLSNLTGFPTNIIQGIFKNEIISNQTMRELIQSFDITHQVKERPTVAINGRVIKLDQSVLLLCALMRRLNFTTEDIIHHILSIKSLDKAEFHKKITPYLFLLNDNIDSLSISILENDESLRTTVRHILTLKEDGTGYLNSTRFTVGRNDCTNYQDIVKKILEYVV